MGGFGTQVTQNHWKLCHSIDNMDNVSAFHSNSVPVLYHFSELFGTTRLKPRIPRLPCSVDYVLTKYDCTSDGRNCCSSIAFCTALLCWHAIKIFWCTCGPARHTLVYRPISSVQPGYAGTRKVWAIWILMKQEMTGWQWHQLDNI